ncbi:aspartic peptidase domain-containing protein [Aspergillus californicus]
MFCMEKDEASWNHDIETADRRIQPCEGLKTCRVRRSVPLYSLNLSQLGDPDGSAPTRSGAVHYPAAYLTARCFPFFPLSNLNKFNTLSLRMHLRSLVASQLLASAVARSIPRDLTIRQNTNTSAHTISLTATLYGSRFHAPTTIGGETFSLLVDTGSSDTFVIEDDFECYTLIGTDETQRVSEDQCGYDDDAYSINDSTTYNRITNETFQVQYAAGFARGVMATEDISLGGVEVTNQPFGLVDWSTTMGLGASGVLGLAYPIITSAYELNGTLDNENLTTQGEMEPYNPLFVNMYRRGLVAPYFSLALARLDSNQETGDGGSMVLGGLPDVSTSNNYTTVPAEFYDAADIRSANGTKVRSYWATTVDSINYADDSYTTSYQTIIDSGAPVSSVPSSVSEAYNAAFDPPGTWSSYQQAYIVDCDATVPDFEVVLGGASFKANTADMIIHTGQTYLGTELCLSAISPGLEMTDDPTDTAELYILGASFLKSVVAVFDFGNSEMRFASREESGAAALSVLGSGRFLVLVVVGVVLQGIF